MNKLSKIFAAAVLAGAACLPSAQAAGVVQLGFILDESGSIGATNYNTIKTGLANAINTLVPVGGLYEVTVVSFASSATTLVNHMLISTAADRTTAACPLDGKASAEETAAGTTTQGRL